MHASLPTTRLLASSVLALAGLAACAAPTSAGLSAFREGDFDQAQQEWAPLAEQGDAEAQFLLGLMYEDGKGVEADASAAAAWYRRAADQGHASAQNNLGLLHFRGLGVRASDVEAERWFRRAAERGHAGALNNLSVMQLGGRAMALDGESPASQLEEAAWPATRGRWRTWRSSWIHARRPRSRAPRSPGGSSRRPRKAPATRRFASG